MKKMEQPHQGDNNVPFSSDITQEDSDWWPWNEMKTFEECLCCPICKVILLC